MNSCREVDKIFSNFSDFLFNNLKRVLLSKNLIVDVQEFNNSIEKFSSRLEMIIEKNSLNFESCIDYHKKCLELCELLKEEFDLTKDILKEIESGGFINQLTEYQSTKTEEEIKEIIEDILT